MRTVSEFILETAAKGGKRADGKSINWDEEWLNSENGKEVKREIQRIKSERSKVEPRALGEQHEFASPVVLQTTELTKRLFIQYWRDPAYLYGKLFVSVIVGIFNGFTFWQLGNRSVEIIIPGRRRFRLKETVYLTFKIACLPSSSFS